MENLMLKGLQDLFDQLETGQLAPEQERFIILEFYKESIVELAEESAELKRRLWEYQNRYHVGVLPTSGD